MGGGGGAWALLWQCLKLPPIFSITSIFFMNDLARGKVWVRNLIFSPWNKPLLLSGVSHLGLLCWDCGSHVEIEDFMLRLRSNLILNLNMISSNSTWDPRSPRAILNSSTAGQVGYPLKSKSLCHREKIKFRTQTFFLRTGHICKRYILQKKWI